MAMYKYPVTVFTPTYNRAYILNVLYESLKRQTVKDFEWLIVDDGSTDDTESVVAGWIAEKIIDIRYVKKSNGGKHTAIDVGTDIAEGKWFAVIDSDDYFVDNAVERIIYWSETIDDNGMISGLFFQRGVYEGDVLAPHGKSFEGVYSDFVFDNAKSNGVTGEKAMCFLTSVYKNYKFPVFEGEKFVMEGIPINEMCDDGYTIRWVNEVTQVFKYISDGLTAQGDELNWKNPKAYAYWLISRAYSNGKKPGLKWRNRLYFQYTWEMKNRIPMKEIANNLHVSRIRLRALLILYSFKRRRK